LDAGEHVEKDANVDHDGDLGEPNPVLGVNVK
jgi:hypothetical protein